MRHVNCKVKGEVSSRSCPRERAQAAFFPGGDTKVSGRDSLDIVITLEEPEWPVDYSTTENLLRTCEGIPVRKVIFSCLQEGESLLDYFYRLKENQHSCSTTFMRDFLQKVLDVDHYPMVLRDTIIVEPYIDAPAKACVEGCVYNKEILHWAISDSLHWPGQDIPFQGSYMPSTLSEVIQRRLWGGFDKVVGRMAERGFNNQFVHVEYFILADGQIKLIEVNARMSGNLSGMYAACLSRRVQLQALLGLCCGVRPALPAPTGRAALNLPLQVHNNYTGKVRDMVNLSEVEILKEDTDVKIIWMMSFDDEFLHGKMEFAKLWTYGKTPDDAKKKCREVTRRLVKKPEQLKFNFP
uniref:ATP-grasp domain-containing protein n=1 Tax=Branchiostoma floridae TaxID=7739 RepID=C3ZQE8_BRAFL|eukprot:XP_002589193.1 hypothetical protein BRAFLDRAFT_120775 [Branchiostoma floridae]